MKDIIKALDLLPYERGGFAKETFCAEHQIKIDDVSSPIGLAKIYYLQHPQVIAWHYLPVDATFHHYAGCSMTIHTIDQNGELRDFSLGNITESLTFLPQVVIAKNRWIASEIDKKDDSILFGSVFVPSPKPYFAKMASEKNTPLLTVDRFPQHELIINRLKGKPPAIHLPSNF